MASILLMHAGVADLGPSPQADPRGGGGAAQAALLAGATILNPHLAVGTKDNHGLAHLLEPLSRRRRRQPRADPGRRGADAPERRHLSRTARASHKLLKKDVKWADGKPFTADDVVFTWQFVADQETACSTIGIYLDREGPGRPADRQADVQGADAGLVRAVRRPTADGARSTCSTAYIGAKARDAPFNLKSFGTGPYMVVDFKPGDLVVYARNPNYREPARPFFDRIELKGGGDADLGRAGGLPDRRVRLRLEPAGRVAEVLEDMEKAARARCHLAGGGVELIHLNLTDPNGGRRRASSLKAPAPVPGRPEGARGAGAGDATARRCASSLRVDRRRRPPTC